MLTIKYQTAFKRDYKRIKKRGYDLRLLAQEQELPPAYRDHALTGDYSGCRECHIAPDWLLVYEVLQDELLLYLTRTGTHSDLF